MSTLVEDINTALNGEVSAAIGVAYTALKNVLTVENNSFIHNDKKFGTKPLFARTSNVGIVGHYTLDQDFQVILTHSYKNNGVDDQDQRDKTFLLYDKMDEIFKRIYRKKVGLPATVLNIDNITMEAPEYIERHKVVVLRSSVTITYRNQTS